MLNEVKHLNLFGNVAEKAEILRPRLRMTNERMRMLLLIRDVAVTYRKGQGVNNLLPCALLWIGLCQTCFALTKKS